MYKFFRLTEVKIVSVTIELLILADFFFSKKTSPKLSSG